MTRQEIIDLKGCGYNIDEQMMKHPARVFKTGNDYYYVDYGYEQKEIGVVTAVVMAVLPDDQQILHFVDIGQSRFVNWCRDNDYDTTMYDTSDHRGEHVQEIYSLSDSEIVAEFGSQADILAACLADLWKEYENA